MPVCAGASKVSPIVSGGGASVPAMRCAPISTHSCTARVKVERNDVLKIGIVPQRFRIGWAFVRDAPNTAAQGFELLPDYIPIHARLLSARILLRYGR